MFNNITLVKEKDEALETTELDEFNKAIIKRTLNRLKKETNPEMIASLIEIIATSFTSSRECGHSHTIHLTQEEKEILKNVHNPILDKLYRNIDILSNGRGRVYITPENEWGMLFLRDSAKIYTKED